MYKYLKNTFNVICSCRCSCAYIMYIFLFLCTTFDNCNIISYETEIESLNMCKSSLKQISITGWNVNGVFQKSSGVKVNKMETEEVRNYFTSDIVFLSETHCCLKEALSLDGYKSFMNCRSLESSK